MEEQKREGQKPYIFCSFYRFSLNHFSVPLHHRPQFLADDGDVLTGMVLYASQDRSRRWFVPPQVLLIVETYGGDEWWVSPANVVIPR